MTPDQKLALSTWTALNNAVRDCDEQAARDLLELEINGKKRVRYVFRIHSRINKLRADKEREDLRRRLFNGQ